MKFTELANSHVGDSVSEKTGPIQSPRNLMLFYHKHSCVVKMTFRK